MRCFYLKVRFKSSKFSFKLLNFNFYFKELKVKAAEATKQVKEEPLLDKENQTPLIKKEEYSDNLASKLDDIKLETDEQVPLIKRYNLRDQAKNINYKY